MLRIYFQNDNNLEVLNYGIVIPQYYTVQLQETVIIADIVSFKQPDRTLSNTIKSCVVI